MRWKTNLLSAALSGVMLLGGITLLGATAQARDRDGCRDISSEERELQHNIRRYGYYSSQAQHERRELDRLRANCWGGNRGWGDNRRWGNNRGFWRRDGDHDRDDRRSRGRDRDDRRHDRDDGRGWRHRDRDRDDDRH